MDLAMEHRDWVGLIDDRRPLAEAARLGLQVLCSPVLAVELYKSEALRLDEVVKVLARLATMQTVSPELLELALVQLARAREAGG